ncbi:hypothetical protein KK060_08765 [Fulvivirgaceae bacterium PWU20]|uniref:Right-handed parallel beta-helix repeat-containing protein n=2 Tax=Chryseosolibacter indicus TaxID=2782351 RepID=A0ABS5VPM7_9BACT|nr:hypothetical protein [Chryseosolibacter indicus]
MFRKLFITFIILSFSNSVFSINRIASAIDKQIYGNYITEGDLIIDSPTKIYGENREVIYYFMQKQWPLIREGATIWFDGDKLGYLSMIKFCNTADEQKPWHISSATFRNIPGTRVMTKQFVCQGLKNIEVNGESPSFPGLSKWPETRKFLTGSFGFHVIAKIFQGHNYGISVLDGGTIKLRGIESQHGFTAIRINGGNRDLTVESIEITNFYIHDTGDGEGMYLGATHAPPLAKIKNLKIYNGIITRTAAEALQLQHLIGGADIHHVTIRAADVRWRNEFRAGQDTGIQWSVDAGDNKLHHIILDGYGSVGLVPFGSNVMPIGGTSRVSNVLFSNGLDIGVYLHNSGKFGIEWQFDSLYFRRFSTERSYYQNTGRPERKYMISRRHGKDKYSFKNIVHDGTRPSVFEKNDSIEVRNVKQKELPAPSYVNSGFHESPSRIKQWYPHYAGFFPASRSGKVKIASDWEEGDIAIETEKEYAFYKCIATHFATEERPSQSKNFVKLTWDENGVRSDQPTWVSELKQSNFPPDDLRLEDNCYWNKLKLGFNPDLFNQVN